MRAMKQRPTTPTDLFERLPLDVQQIFQRIAADARDVIGDVRQFQSIFDRHIAALDRLNGQGLSHAEIGLALAAVGVARDGSRPLSRGTVSSGLSRARTNAAARSALSAALPSAAACCNALQSAAPCCNVLQPAAAGCSETQRPLPQGPSMRSETVRPAVQAASELAPPSAEPFTLSGQSPVNDAPAGAEKSASHVANAEAASLGAAAFIIELRSKE